MRTPLVSIVMCTYNGARFIDEQIDSIMKQDFTDFELVIVDDRSTDDTFERLEQWAGKSEKVRIFRNEVNLGYNENFAKALGMARGEFISLADQDDIWMPGKIRHLHQALVEQPAVILAHSVSIRLQSGKLNYRNRKLQHHFSGNDARKLFFFNGIMGHDMMFRRELLQYVLPVPDRMSYDWWIAVVAATRGLIASVPEAIVHHRIHETNSFFKKTTDARKKEMDIDEVWETFLTIPSLTGVQRNFLERSLRLVKSQAGPSVKFKPSLFWHLLTNRRFFFGHKRRLFPIISHFKHSLKYAKTDFRNKGTV